MSVSSDYLPLIPPLIILLGVGIMIGWEVAIASGALAAFAGFFIKASEPNSSQWWAVAGFLFLGVFVIAASDSIRRVLARRAFRILAESNLKKLVNYALMESYC